MPSILKYKILSSDIVRSSLGRKLRIGAFKALFYALFGSKTTTLADGTRQLVNEGVTGKDRIKHLINDDFSGGVNDWVTEGHVLVDNSEEALTLTSGEGTSKYWQNYVSQNNIKLEGKAGVEYVVEIEHLSGRRFVVVLDGAVSWTARYTPAVGSLKFSFITENTQNLRMRVYLDTNLPNIVGTIDNIKLYKKSDLAKHGTLHSGHGAYFNGVDNYIVVPQSGSSITEFTMLASVSGFSAGLGIRHIAHFGSRKNQLASGLAVQNSGYVINHTWGNVNESSTVYIGDGGDYSLGLVVSGSDQYLYANGALGESKQIDIDVALTNAVIGSRLAALLGEYALGNIKDVYLIPQALTAEEIQSHYNNPEQTLYWENGTLKSAFLPQATIDAMQAGEGFWYPLSGNESTGGYERNHALAMPENLVTNGDFSDGLINANQRYDTLLKNQSGKLYMENVSASWGGSEMLYATEVGKEYLVRVKVNDWGGGASYSSFMHLGTGVGSLAYTVNVPVNTANNMAIAKFTATATTANVILGVGTNTIGAWRSIEYVDVVEASTHTPMQNWNTTNVTNALGVSTSTVTESYTVDEFGMQKDWPDAKPVITGELYGDGRSYVDMNDMVISGDFEIDIYIGSQTEGKISRVLKFAHYDSSGTSLAQSFIQTLEGVDAYNVVPFGAADSVYSYPSSGDVVTVIFASGTRSIYHNNLLQKTTNTATDLANSVLQDLTLRKAGTGTLQITQGTRTDEQRAKDIQKLATKHGVII